MAFVVVVFSFMANPFIGWSLFTWVCFLKIGGSRTVGRKKIGSEQP